MSWKLVGVASMALALAACDMNNQNRTTGSRPSGGTAAGSTSTGSPGVTGVAPTLGTGTGQSAYGNAPSTSPIADPATGRANAMPPPSMSNSRAAPGTGGLTPNAPPR